MHKPIPFFKRPSNCVSRQKDTQFLLRHLNQPLNYSCGKIMLFLPTHLSCFLVFSTWNIFSGCFPFQILSFISGCICSRRIWRPHMGTDITHDRRIHKCVLKKNIRRIFFRGRLQFRVIQTQHFSIVTEKASLIQPPKFWTRDQFQIDGKI